VNTLLKSSDYQYLLSNSRARIAIVSQSLLPLILEIPRKDLRFLERIVVVGVGGPPGVTTFDELLQNSSTNLDPAPTRKDDAAFWLYSSGSTGPPKACVHLQHDMVVSAERYAKAILKISESDRFFSVAKLFFAYGLGNALYFPLAVGATSILFSGPPRPQSIFEVIERHRPTLFFSVPSHYVKMLAHVAHDREFDLSSIRHAISAGEALPASVFHRFKQRFGIEILDAIGSTEALHMMLSNAPGAIRPGSSGKVLPGFEAKIVDDNDQPVARGEIGNLMVKADSACAYYWNEHDKTKNTIAGHWLRTGDKYHEDEDGYFWYEGRSDDVLKVSGVWVSPFEIESVLSEHPCVLEAAVVFWQDRDELFKPAACVVLRDGIDASQQLALEIQDFVVQRLPSFKRPHWVEFLAELPKTATGKVQRYKLRTRTALGRFGRESST
ncbi:MAG TPA: benzoate-CoA ligase family protein, partial [Candidatus Sulfotelmatobacter sp.]|nr:benzoate-CoA ligase family protein [Candidatus Sulfotelmatobacter sp.]